MKKLMTWIFALALILAIPAVAEEADGIQVETLIEDGEFIIQLDVSDGDLAWLADDMAQDSSVVKLAFEDTLEDTYVVRYSPVADGEATVAIRHYVGTACDRFMAWDLLVQDGVVQEVTGGAEAMSPSDEEIDPYLVGEWLEEDTQFTQMTVEKNPERGWDLEIVSPVSHGAYIFKTSVLFDCERNCFVYDKGKFWDIDGTYEEGAELGEARDAGTTGSFTFVGDDENLILEWQDDVYPENTVLFERGAE